MDAAPILFDRRLARARLARAQREARPGADFLVARVAAELADRLPAVLRRFERAADIGTPTTDAARVLAASEQVGDVLRLSPIAEVAAGPGWSAVVGDEEQLPLAPASLDLAVSLLSLQT